MVARIMHRRPAPSSIPVRRHLADMLSTTRRAYRLAIVTLFHGVPVLETAGAVHQLVDDVKAMDLAARARLAAYPAKRGEVARIIDCAAACSAVARIGDVCADLVDLAGATPDLSASSRVEHTSAEAETVSGFIRRAWAVLADPATPADGSIAEMEEFRRRLATAARDDLARAPSPDRAASAVFHGSLDDVVAALVLVTEFALGVAPSRVVADVPPGGTSGP